jgi:DNA-binding protein HU-beta
LLSNPLSHILPLSSFKFHPNRRPQVAKKPMTKSQIVSHFAGKFELSKKSSAAILDEVAALAVSETKKAGSFSLPGIGKLVLVKRKARMGRNPATGEPLKIPAKTVVKMRVAKAAKEAIVPGRK